MTARGLKVGSFSISPSSTGVIIANNGHHLTVFVDETNENLNVHLTQENPGLPKKNYLGSKNIGLKELEELSIQMADLIYSNLYRVKIEALNRDGYVLICDKERRMEEVFGKHSPVSKRKIRPDLKEIVKEFGSLPFLEEMAHRPKILYEKGVRGSSVIVAEPLFAKRDLPTLHLVYLPIEGYEGWYSYVPDDIFASINELISSFLEPYAEFGKLVSEKMDLDNSLNDLIEVAFAH